LKAGNGSGTCERVGDATSVPGPYGRSVEGWRAGESNTTLL
jgi:hypothetical protein